MTEIFSGASEAWSRLAPFREERSRSKRYVYGDQWADMVNDGTGFISEAECIRRLGQTPLKNNILRRILRNVTGLYRAQYKVPLLTPAESGLKGKALRDANAARRRWFYENRMEELAPRLLEEFLISGLVAVKVQGRGVLSVTPDNFFFHSDGYDPRGLDVDLIGEVHRLGFGTLLERFCRTADDYRRLSEAFPPSSRLSGGCRLLEVWTRETRLSALLHDEAAATLKVLNLDPSVLSPHELRSCLRLKTQDLRLIAQTSWRPRWYAADGTLLREGESQKAHPYVFKAYPFIDGEIHSYVGDLIDQQRYVNRLITLYDFIMKSSAKGVLLFPEECLPAGMDLRDVADEWSRANGVIPIRTRPGVPLPTQVGGNTANIGITELLKIQMQMLEDISGVSPTLQGKLQNNSTSGTLFAQQNEAAQTSLLDILRSFSDFLRHLATRTPQQCG